MNTITIKKQSIVKMVEEAQIKFPQFNFSITEKQGYTKGKQMSSGVYYTPPTESKKGYKIEVTMKFTKFTCGYITIFNVDTTKTRNARIDFAEFCENHETFVHRRTVDPEAYPVKPYTQVEFEN